MEPGVISLHGYCAASCVDEEKKGGQGSVTTCHLYGAAITVWEMGMKQCCVMPNHAQVRLA